MKVPNRNARKGNSMHKLKLITRRTKDGGFVLFVACLCGCKGSAYVGTPDGKPKVFKTMDQAKAAANTLVARWMDI
jgi:hypothetical protein